MIMLISASKIIERLNTLPKPVLKEQVQPETLRLSEEEIAFVDDREQSLTKSIGILEQGKTLHYYSYGNFNLVRLLVYLMKQTGPVNVFMTSYSFSQKSIDALLNQRRLGNLLSFKVIVDNRVRSMSPKPFQMLTTVFDYRCSSIHAKVALLWNEHWKITVVTSQNATDNPKLERGIIFTDPDVFNFDLNALENEFKRGTT